VGIGHTTAATLEKGNGTGRETGIDIEKGTGTGIDIGTETEEPVEIGIDVVHIPVHVVLVLQRRKKRSPQMGWTPMYLPKIGILKWKKESEYRIYLQKC